MELEQITETFNLENESFNGVSITKAKEKSFFYFEKNGLPIKEFVLKNLKNGEKKICRVVLIKKDNIYEPKISFLKINEKKNILENGKAEQVSSEKITASINLNDCFDNFKKLINFLIESENIDFEPSKYATIEKILERDDFKEALIEKLIEEGNSKDFCQKIIDRDFDASSAMLKYIEEKNKKKALEEFKGRLEDDTIKEVAGDESWQKWFNKNYWFFGANYIQVIDRQIINISGSMPDFLYLSLDDFIDILEIKLPHDNVIIEDRSHPNSWRWTLKTSEAIGQVVNYLSDIDRLRLEIEKEIKNKYGLEVNLLKPRAYILIGNSESWKSDKKEALRKLNYALHGIDVLTYNDLSKRVENNLKVYKKYD